MEGFIATQWLFSSIITVVIQPEGYNMNNCVSQIMEQDYTATRRRPEFCILTL